MNPNNFVKKAQSVDTNYPNVNERLKDNTKLQALVHGALGMSGETGEVVDLIKKHLIFDKPLDETALKKELGDVLWYMAVLIDAIGSSFEEIMQMNSDKIDARYPNGFSEQAALERKDMKP
jgi:NTP pyrophosphatase (non-canonical NTP hydrolase)